MIRICINSICLVLSFQKSRRRRFLLLNLKLQKRGHLRGAKHGKQAQIYIRTTLLDAGSRTNGRKKNCVAFWLFCFRKRCSNEGGIYHGHKVCFHLREAAFYEETMRRFDPSNIIISSIEWHSTSFPAWLWCWIETSRRFNFFIEMFQQTFNHSISWFNFEL